MIHVSDPNINALNISLAFESTSQFAPDCKVSYYGSLVSPNLMFVEGAFDSMKADLEETLEIQRKLQAVPAAQDSADRWNNLLNDLASAEKRQTLSCMQIVQQANRRTGVTLTDRSDEVKAFLDFSIGPSLASYEGILDAKEICVSRRLEVQNILISGIVSRLVKEMMAADELKQTLSSLKTSCAAKSCDGGLRDLMEKSIRKDASKMAEFIGAVESYALSMESETKELEAGIVKDSITGWQELQKELNSEGSILLKVLAESKENR